MRERVGNGWDDMNPLTKSRNVSNKYGVTEDKLNGMSKDKIELYVDVLTGVDSVSRGTLTEPFKTIQYAVDQVGKYINNDVYIWISDGVYEEEVRIKGFVGSALVVGRKDGIIPPHSGQTGFQIISIEVMDCTGLVRINNASQYNAGCIKKEAFIRASRSAYVTVHGVWCGDTAIAAETIQFDGSTGSVNNSYFNGQRYCVISKNGSSVRVDSTNTHGTTKSGTGILSQAAEVYQNGLNEWTSGASNELATGMGGKINSQIEVLDLTPLLQSDWLAYDQNRNMPRAIKHNGVVYLQGLIKDGQVGQGKVAFKLPRLWTPQFNNRFYAPFGSDGQRTKVQIDVQGTCVVEVSTGQYISLSDIPPFYVGF